MERPSSSGAEDAAARVWWNHDWTPSLEYYAWSSQCRFADGDDADGSKRRDLLEAYSARGPAPKRLVPEGESIELPAPLPPAHPRTASEVLFHRRSTRRFARREVDAEVLSGVLHSGTERVRGTRRRAATDGALGALRSYGVAFDLYLCVFDVQGIAAGTYFYDLEPHALRLVAPGEQRAQISECLFGQSAPCTAAWTVFLVADFVQYQWRYRHERALRNLYIESGRIAQHLIVAALRWDLASLSTPAIADTRAAEQLALEVPRQQAMYSVTSGPDPRPQRR